MKIIYLVSTLRRSGPTNQLLNLLRHLDKEKFNALVVTLSAEPADSMFDAFSDLDISVKSLGLSRIKGLFFGWKKLKQIIQNEKPDLVHSSGIRPDSMAAKIRSCPVVNTIRNYPFIDYPMKFGKLRGTLMARTHFSVFRKMKNNVACSQAIFKQLYSKKHLSITVIQNGVDTEKFRPYPEKEIISLKKKLGLPADAYILVSVGALIPRKRHDIAISAFKQLKNSGNMILLILGGGFLLEELKQLAEANPQIRFHGQVDNVSEYLGCSDLFVSASVSEGLPNTVLEAMACGVPAVLSDIEPHIEIISEEQPFASLFKLNSEADLIRVLEKQSSRKTGNNDRKSCSRFIADNFSAKIMSRNYQDLYTKLIRKS